VLISAAHAQAPAASAPGFDMNFIIMMVLMFVVLYFFMIRPQMKRAKEQKAMVEALQRGDEVVALGGLVGKIIEISEQYVTLEIAPQTQIILQKQAVQLPLPKGTIKSIK